MIRFSVLRKLTIPAVLLLCAINAEAGAMRAYVGTYTSGESQGIYRLDFDSETGAVQVAGLAAAVENPSFLAIHPRLPMLYAACRAESGDAIVAFEMVTGSGDLKRVDAEPAGGQGPCHVAVSPDGAPWQTTEMARFRSSHWMKTAAWAPRSPSFSTKAPGQTHSGSRAPTRTRSISTPPAPTSWSRIWASIS
jgi:hypothetical protein